MISNPVSRRLLRRFSSAALALAMSLTLLACGGGGGGGGGGAGGGGQTATTTVGSLYVRDTGSAYFWSLALRNAGATPESYEYYAVHDSTSTTLYSGTLTAGTGGNASYTGKAMRGTSVDDSSGSFSDMLANSTLVSASFDSALAPPLPLSLSATPVQPLTTAGVINKNWSGRWVDGLNSADPLSISVAASSASLSVSGCTQGVQVQLASLASAPGLYRATLVYPDQTGCSRRNTTLTGLAAVQALSSGGHRLYLAATANGNGVSFRGDAP